MSNQYRTHPSDWKRSMRVEFIPKPSRMCLETVQAPILSRLDELPCGRPIQLRLAEKHLEPISGFSRLKSGFPTQDHQNTSKNIELMLGNRIQHQKCLSKTLLLPSPVEIALITILLPRVNLVDYEILAECLDWLVTAFQGHQETL